MRLALVHFPYLASSSPSSSLYLSQSFASCYPFLSLRYCHWPCVINFVGEGSGDDLGFDFHSKLQARLNEDDEVSEVDAEDPFADMFSDESSAEGMCLSEERAKCSRE
jgi:hypothetical protein